MKRGVRYISGICLLVIFLAYLAGGIFFSHTHNVNGQTLVHSHPFKHTGSNKPSHEHPFSAYFLINAVNNYLSVEHKPVSAELSVMLLRNDKPAVYNSNFSQENSLLFSPLRAPPAI